MLEQSLIDGFEAQLAETKHQLVVEQTKLHFEEDLEKSLELRERVRLIETFLGAVKDSLSRVVLADGAIRDGLVKFLRWRTAAVEASGFREARDHAEKALKKARADVEPAQRQVDLAEVVITNFKRLPAEATEPQREAERVELAKLEAARSEAMAKRSGLQLVEGEAMRKWMAAGEALAHAELVERNLRRPEPLPEKHSIGELSGVK